jgi:hypothetical protein
MKNLLTGMVTVCLMLFGQGQAQSQQITGYVYDIETQKPLSGVNIFIGGTEPGAATNSDGFFKLKITKFPVILFFSHVGYELNKAELKTPGISDLKIYLKPEIRQIGEVTISGERIMNLIKGDTLNIVDYEIAGEQILMIANTHKHLNEQRLYLTTISGEIISSKKTYGAGHLVNIPESIDVKNQMYLYKDCFNSIQLLTSEAVYQVFVNGNKVNLIYPTPFEEFETMLLPVKAALEGHLFQQKASRKSNSTFHMAPGDTVSRLVKTVTDPFGDFRYVRPIDFLESIPMTPAAEFLIKDSYERCVTAPVIQRKNDIAIFDFFGNTIDFFNPEGNLLKSVPIKFHLREYTELLVIRRTDIDMDNFSQRILYDEKADRIYALWHLRSTGRYSLKEINPDNGEIIRVVEVPDYPFIDRMRVYGNTLYFLYTEKTYPFYRSLYRMIL